MTTTVTDLAPSLRDALDALHIDRDAHTVTVEDETVTADSSLRMRQELGTVLYRHWHSGAARPHDERDLRRDHRFEDLLREATPHRFSKTPAVVKSSLLDSPVGRHALFDVGRVRLQIPESAAPQPLPAIGTRITLDLPAIRPALSPGFYLVNGSAGGPSTGGPVLRVYLHLDESSAAPAVWHAVLSYLEGCEARYRAKVLAKAGSYPRRDAVVVYLGEESWPLVPGIAQCVQHLPGRNPEHSLLTVPVAEGIACAWDPTDSRVGWGRMSFGQHRTAIAAAAIADHVFDADGGTDLHSAVADALVEGNVDPGAPYRNSESPAIAAGTTTTSAGGAS